MNIVETIQSFNVFDLVFLLFLFGMFVLGYIQGSVRRIVGALSFIFSFFLAAVLSVPFGSFLQSYWTQYPDEYSWMIAFLTVFVAAIVAFFLVIQGTYSKTALFAKYPTPEDLAAASSSARWPRGNCRFIRRTPSMAASVVLGRVMGRRAPIWKGSVSDR